LASASSPVKPNGVCGVPVLLSGWPYGSYAHVSSTALALPATARTLPSPSASGHSQPPALSRWLSTPAGPCTKAAPRGL
jgi:hypothetical protein